MNLEIEKIGSQLSNITRDEIKEIALNFVGSDIPPLKRALIVFILKKLIEDIEKMDKDLYERHLKDYYLQNKNSSSPPELGDFQVICREITKKVYLDQAKASEIESKIKELKKELESLEHYEETIKKTYFIKHKGER